MRHIVKALFTIIISSFCTLSFAQTEVFSPFSSENPWPDNYFSISKMENYKKWGPYNVHDPACKKFGEYYYMYSTDAIFRENKKEAKEKNIPIGYIQIRRSKDLVNWEFLGWAFPEIPEEAIDWVRSQSGGKGATNIWAPYIIQYKDIYRLYYCVSAFGRKTSYLGLAESSSPEGSWTLKGCVVKTNNESPMNAIDPSIIIDSENKKWWMHYGSFFGGLYCVELDPSTGLTKEKNDLGHLIARRANYTKDNLEAPEIIYHPELKKYFFFYSYDPLMTTYNVRAARSENPEGPFFDFFGENIKDTTNNFPVLTAPYIFNNHQGWAGTGHCGIVMNDDGQFFMLHQARLSPDNAMMVLHVRQIFFTPDGWPVVSPERYAGDIQQKFTQKDLAGEWEIIRIQESIYERNLEAGQILWGEGNLKEKEWNKSFVLTLTENGKIDDKGNWKFSEDKQLLHMNLNGENIQNLIIHKGQDWENERKTIIFTGLDQKGRSVWGKRIK